MVEIISQGCYGIMKLTGSPRDDLVVKQSKEIWSWNFRILPTACKVLKYYVVSFQPCIGVIKLLTQP